MSAHAIWVFLPVGSDVCLMWRTVWETGCFPGGSDGKESACNARDPDSIPGSGRFLGEGNGNHSSILGWKIPWTEEPGGLQSRSLQRIRHNLAIKQQQQHPTNISQVKKHVTPLINEANFYVHWRTDLLV